jgi:glycosyltransferase involved in cell wall biosynthesis
MKILHITKKYKNALGGDAVVVSNLEKQQLARGHEVFVLTSNCDEIIDDEQHYKFGLPATAAALDEISLSRLASLGALFFKTFGVIRKERPDVIHTHSIDMAFITSIPARLFKVSVVHTFHILTFPDSRQDALRRKSELFLTKGARPRIITSPNQVDVDHLKRAGVKDARFMMNGVDLAFWRKEKQPHNVFTFITAARLERQKGIEYLIRAAAELKGSRKPFKLVIVGEGSLKEELKALAKELAVDEMVEFAGRKSPEELRDLYTLSDSVVIPSLWEAAPLTVFEAWAMELPLIITKIGTFANETDDRTYAKVVDVGDSNALAEAMEELMTDGEKRAAMIAAGHEVVQEYNWPAVADIANDLYVEARGTIALNLGKSYLFRPAIGTRSARSRDRGTQGARGPLWPDRRLSGPPSAVVGQ